MTPPQDWSAKSPLIIGTLTLILLVAGFGSWGVLTNIAGAIIATGRLEADQSRQVIQHPDGGVVASVSVREGDHVTKGQPLISLEATQLQSKLSIAEAQLFEILARISRLEAERDDASGLKIDPLLAQSAGRRPELRVLIDGQARLLRTRQSAHAQSIAQLRKRKEQFINQVAGIKAQRKALSTQIRLVDEEIAARKTLHSNGQAPTSVILPLRREKARLQGQLGEVTASVAESEGRITEADLEILRVGTRRKEDAITQLRDLQYRAFTLREDRANLLQRLSRLDLVAPVSGHVFGMTVFSERTVIRPAEPLLFIVPEDRPLMITAQIDPLNIDEVYQDQEVTLHFATFERQNTPELRGRVTNISSDVFTDRATGRAYYRVEIALQDGEIARLGDVALVQGMPVDAFIQTGERAPLTYLIKPLSEYFNRAFRET